MAYSDYGGYAYRNGKRVPECSDASVKDNLGNLIDAHVVLGDSGVRVLLYKQSYIKLIYQGRIVDIKSLVGREYLDSWTDSEGITTTSIDIYRLVSTGEPCSFELFGYKITIYWREEDNFYQYVKLEQPDGTIWTGFSGYGVGAGFDADPYGFCTRDREEELFNLFNITKLQG